MNYETVKTFNNEKYEQKKYGDILTHLRTCALKVQKSLSELNVGQMMIFNTGMVVNLLMAANDVSNGLISTGDFILISTYFMQMSGPLFNMGMFFREVTQSQVDVEDLFHMLKQKPSIVESPDAKPF